MSRHPLYVARIKERYALTKPGSTKATYHIVLDLQGCPFSFKVGDSLGIYPHNDPLIVERWLSRLEVAGETQITDSRSGQMMSLESFLAEKANLGRVTPKLAEVLSYTGPLDIDPLEILRPMAAQELVSLLAPLLPRFYSVASSLIVHPNEAHLTVVLSTYEYQGEIRYGVASHFLCHLAIPYVTPILCYVQPAAHFTIPAESHLDLIMIGPGTGVAPFRAFMQERLALSATGNHWLFFGERHRATDFLYEDFWMELSQQNKLRLDLAFSRDQAEKVYVQHKMEENAAEIWDWISRGAYTYLCGEADPMAKEVEQTLLKIFEIHGNLSTEAARLFLKTLRKEKRLLADVY
ncbi:MAG: sulfite reductase [Verrucomicrobia bacterium]|nr:sulfite reductase [Verrucomicrobiota bacterium]